MIIGLFRNLLIFFAVLLSAVYAAEPSLLDSTTGFVPPGFEHIDNDYDGEAEINIGHKFIGIAGVEFYDKSDKFLLSKEAQKMIFQYIEDKALASAKTLIEKQLSEDFIANSRLKYKHLARSDDKVSVYYSYINTQVYVFIPNSYLKSAEKNYNHARNKEYKLNYSPSLSSRFNINYDKYSAGQYSWQAAGGLSAANLNLKYDVNGQIQGDFNDLYLEYYDNKYLYKMGYQESTHANIMAPSGNIWGVSAISNPSMINDKFYSAYSAPLAINLDSPYNVTISYRGRQLFSGVLPQGESIINTSNFPAGTYSIDIEKRDLVSGVTTTETQMFYGRSGKYNWLYSGFELFVGYESEYYNSPSADRLPYIRIKNGYKYADGEVDLSYIHGEKINFIGGEYTAFSNSHYNYGVSTYLSQHFDWYFSGNINYINGPSRYQAYIRNGYQDNEYQQGRQHHLGGSYSYKYDNWQLNLNASVSGDNNYSVSSIVSTQFKLHDLPARVSLSHNISDSNTRTVLSFQLSFDQGGIKSSVSTTYNDRGELDLGVNANWSKDNYYASQRFSIATNSNDASYSYTDVGYKNKYANMKADVSFTENNNSFYANSLEYNIDSNILITPGSIDFSRERFGAGYLVNLPIINEKHNYMYDVENKKYKQGQSVFVSKQSYRSSTLTVTPRSRIYSISYPTQSQFFFPDNVILVTPKLNKSCLVSFVPSIHKGKMFTLVGRENDFFGYGGVSNTLQLHEGEVINIKSLGSDEICNTGVVVKCDEMHVKLGKIPCLKKTKEASAANDYKFVPALHSLLLKSNSSSDAKQKAVSKGSTVKKKAVVSSGKKASSKVHKLKGDVTKPANKVTAVKKKAAAKNFKQAIPDIYKLNINLSRYEKEKAALASAISKKKTAAKKSKKTKQGPHKLKTNSGKDKHGKIVSSRAVVKKKMNAKIGKKAIPDIYKLKVKLTKDEQEKAALARSAVKKKVAAKGSKKTKPGLHKLKSNSGKAASKVSSLKKKEKIVSKEHKKPTRYLYDFMSKLLGKDTVAKADSSFKSPW